MTLCHVCAKELNLSELQGKSKKAACICAECVRKSISKEEVEELLNP